MLVRGAAFFADAFFVALVPPAAFLVVVLAADLRVVFFVAFFVVLLAAFLVAFFVVFFAGADFLAGAFLAGADFLAGGFFVVFFAGADFLAGAFFVGFRADAPVAFLAAAPVDFLTGAFFVDLAVAFFAGVRPEDFLADFLAVERFVATLPSPSLHSDRDGSHPLRGHGEPTQPLVHPVGRHGQ